MGTIPTYIDIYKSYDNYSLASFIKKLLKNVVLSCLTNNPPLPIYMYIYIYIKG